jgi:hypothetical protein
MSDPSRLMFVWKTWVQVNSSLTGRSAGPLLLHKGETDMRTQVKNAFQLT